MKLTARILGWFIVFAVVCDCPCYANNNLFLPGDSFFPTTFTKEDITELQATKSAERTFKYSSLDGYSEAFCGNAGYFKAKIPAVDDEFAKNLGRVYQDIRSYQGRNLYEQSENGTTKLIETNGIRVLFYSQDFNFPRHHLGLRYNENWVNEALKFGHKKHHLRLCCLISDRRAVEHSWRDADAVPRLNAELPKLGLKGHPDSEAPVVVRGPVKAIVIGSYTLEDIFLCKEDDYLSISIIDSNGISKLTHSEGEWRPPDSDPFSQF